MRRAFFSLLFFASTFTSVAQEATRPPRPVHTFSIVARDAQTGEIGVAVQSHWFSVGALVPWAEAGVGAVATQSFVDPSYGPKGLEHMRNGESAPQVLAALLAEDKSCFVRQVAMIDAKGDVATFTGVKDITAAGGIAGNSTATGKKIDCGGEPGGTLQVGKDFAVQANLMANDRVWPAMEKAFAGANGDLADRILAALDAAQSAGGDARGRQSAALMIVKAKGSDKPWNDRTFDLRVEDHSEPLKELRRLVTLARAYNHMNAGDLAVEHNDNAAALREYSTAETLIDGVPGIDQSRLAEMTYWHAVALVNMKRVDESLPLFKKAFKLHPPWRELTRQLPRSGLLPDDDKVIQRLISQ